MVDSQHEKYFQLVSQYKQRAKELAEGKRVRKSTDSGVGMLMNLRKTANHPLLIRRHFDNDQIRILAQLLKKDPSHREANVKYIMEDLSVMSDFDIHKTCLAYRVSFKRIYLVRKIYMIKLAIVYFSVLSTTVWATTRFARAANSPTWTTACRR